MKTIQIFLSLYRKSFIFKNFNKFFLIQFQKSIFNETALHLAAKNNKTKVIEFLLSQKVIEIGKKAFKNTPIKEITIPYFIQSIGDEAFKGCNNLFTVLFETPSSVQKIGNNTFRDCIVLTNIEIPESVTSIGEKAFRQCNKYW